MPPKKRTCKRQQQREIEVIESAVSGDESTSPMQNNEPEGTNKTQKNSKRQHQQPLHLTNEQQDDILTWFQENETLYDKGHADYKLTEKKNAMWKEKADNLGVCDGPRLKSWMDGVRTVYGKLTKRPSGSGGRLSEREKWIMDKLSFLSKHIYRVSSRSGIDLMAKIRERHPERLPDSDDSGEEGNNSQDVEEELHQTTSPTLSTASVEQTLSAASKRKKKTRGEESAALLQRLEERIHSSGKLQERLIDELSAPTDSRVAERRQWAQWFGSAITDINDSLWSEFQAESLKLVNTFKARSKYIRQAAVKPPFVQPYMQSADHEHADFYNARRLQTINYSSNPGGYLPIWQQKYQHPPSQTIPAPSYSGRPQSAPMSLPSATATSTSAQTYDTFQPPTTEVSIGGQTDFLKESMNYSGIPTVDESCEIPDV